MEITPKAAVFASGVVGGVFSWRFIPGCTPKQKILAVLAGGVMAHFIAPPLTYYLANGQFTESAGFAIGVFGMSIMDRVYKDYSENGILGYFLKRKE